MHHDLPALARLSTQLRRAKKNRQAPNSNAPERMVVSMDQERWTNVYTHHERSPPVPHSSFSHPLFGVGLGISICKDRYLLKFELSFLFMRSENE
jgi:hypothetical protein